MHWRIINYVGLVIGIKIAPAAIITDTIPTSVTDSFSESTGRTSMLARKINAIFTLGIIMAGTPAIIGITCFCSAAAS